MSTMIEPTRPSPPRLEAPSERPPVMLPDGRANVSLLEDQLPERWKAPRSLPILTAVLGVIFFTLNRLAIRLTDVWGHLAYGRWIKSHGALPETEPLLQLSQGVPWVDVAWLSKLSGLWVYEQFGVPGLQMIHATTITVAFAVLTLMLWKRTQHLGWTVAGLAAFGLIDYQQLLIHRPQDFGLAAFALVLWWGLSGSDRRSAWVGLPVLFVLWANFHGSFVVGLIALGAVACGRTIDVYRHTRRARLLLRSGYVWRAVLMLELCAAAVLLNPAGIKVYADVLTIASDPNLPALLDWSALTIRTGQGQVFAAAVLLLAMAYRLSPRRVTSVEVLLLAGLGLWSLWSVRMIVWFGFVAGYGLALHGAAAWRRRWRLSIGGTTEERRGLWTVATLGLTWIFFAYTPFGLQRLHGPPPEDRAAAEFRRSVVERTPLDAVDYLSTHADELPAGQMYNSQEWGDYLQWAGPEKFQVFVNSHVHLTPPEVWQDYLQIHDGSGVWLDKLDRYEVNTVLVDTTNYMNLIRALREEEGWKEVFTDPKGVAVLFARRRPI